MKILKNHLMKEYSNMKVGGESRNLIVVDKKEELLNIYDEFENPFIIGKGTNTLLNDNFLDIDFISTENLNNITEINRGFVSVDSGVYFGDLINYMKNNNYSGLENLSGIPGSVGGLIYMNGGAFGTEIFDCIEEVEILDENANIIKKNKKELEISYRKTEIQDKKWIILGANFRFSDNFDLEKVKEINDLRKSKHPLHKPSLGSTFKNPKGEFAAKLISDAGLKGFKKGNAQISEKHPNFILNLGNASFKNIEDLLMIIENKVFENSGIKLQKEIIVLK